MIPLVPNQLVSALSFLGFVLVLIPLPAHWKMSNTGTCLYMAWTAIGCLNQFINSVVWNKNTLNRAPVWCDISVRIMIAVSVAIPAASLCIMRHLYRVTRLRSLSKGEKRRVTIIDFFIGVGLPLLGIVFQYFVEGHLYDIYEDVGCYPMTYITPLAFVFVLCWPLAIGTVSAVYACLIIRACLKHYSSIHASLMASPLKFNVSHYYRLSGLSLAELLFTVPLSSYLIAANTRDISPWLGWADDHWGFSQVFEFPASEWRADGRGAVALEFSRFFLLICSLVFFAFFGFAEEVRRLYWSALVTLVRAVGRRTTWIREKCSRQNHPQLSPSSSPFREKGNPIEPKAIDYKLPPIHELLISFSPNLSLGGSDSVSTLADTQGYMTEFSSDIDNLPPTLSSRHQTVLDIRVPSFAALARPERAHVDAGSSDGSWTLPPSDSIV